MDHIIKGESNKKAVVLQSSLQAAAVSVSDMREATRKHNRNKTKITKTKTESRYVLFTWAQDKPVLIHSNHISVTTYQSQWLFP